MSTERPHEVDSLDATTFDLAAAYSAACLVDFGHALVEFAPGDMTLYRVSIIDSQHGALHEDGRVRGGDMGGQRYVVGSTFGSLYSWSGTEVHHDYVTTHYVTDRNPWTGRVLARFLNRLAEHLATGDPR